MILLISASQVARTMGVSHQCPPSHYFYIIIFIILGLGSTTEQEQGIFGFLGLVYLTQPDDLWFHPFSYK
jgi:hypothetical protein